VKAIWIVRDELDGFPFAVCEDEKQADDLVLARFSVAGRKAHKERYVPGLRRSLAAPLLRTRPRARPRLLPPKAVRRAGMGCPECGARFPTPHEPDCPRRAPEGVPTYCVCGGTGVRKVKDPRTGKPTKRVERCDCGRPVNSSGAAKLGRQKVLDERLEELKKGGSW
jgi:hypothetical protein